MGDTKDPKFLAFRTKALRETMRWSQEALASSRLRSWPKAEDCARVSDAGEQMFLDRLLPARRTGRRPLCIALGRG